mmetsp:Transcript_17273/g.44021  ORF Transcript_17273/g.44021 Transcript_17273/m.44021 type:complete len:203 (-) Transcript_17273:231-839(-)
MPTRMPSHRLVAPDGVMPASRRLAWCLPPSVMKVSGSRTLALLLNSTRDRRSSGSRRAMMVLTACFTTSNVDRPSDSTPAAVLMLHSLHIDPLTSMEQQMSKGARFRTMVGGATETDRNLLPPTRNTRASAVPGVEYFKQSDFEKSGSLADSRGAGAPCAAVASSMASRRARLGASCSSVSGLRVSGDVRSRLSHSSIAARS